MGIRVKNLSNIVIALRAAGTLTATANKDCAKVPFTGMISNIVAKIADGGSGATNTIADLNLNGTTLFSESTKITLASTTGVASYGALTTDPTPVTYGSILSLDVDQISTTASNLIVEVTISKGPVSKCSFLEDQDVVM